ncbi:MAG TPA: dihydrolipoyl dehydrogenase [Blastocatellia bacterium]|nr:dihydrolipoyl dehydrogenase [Blastocatellia bacterium]
MSAANETFDVVIIGAGPGGYTAAARAGQLKLKTAIVEKDPRLGGTCLLRGCIPTKALLENAAIYEHVKTGKEFGISVSDIALDYAAVQQRKNKIVSKSAKGVEFLMKKNSVSVFHGLGSITGKGQVTVKSEDGKSQVIKTKNVLIATGSTPKTLPFIQLDHKKIIDSDDILELQTIPKSLIVLGAGAVGVEFASIFKRFGSEVTIIEVLPRLLPIEDEEISQLLARSFRKQGIASMVGTKCEAVKVNGDMVEVTVSDADGKKQTLSAELLLSAVGRRPVLEGLNLEKTAIKLDRGYIPIDEYMRTAEPNVYAIGDVVPTPWLAHVASSEGIVAIEHMAGVETRPVNYRLVPNCTYCEPEVASVGLSEKAAKEAGHDVKIGKFPFTASSKASILGQSEGTIKIVSEKKYDEILGVHLIGPRVTEMLAEACVAMQMESTAEELARTMHAHPTLSEGVMQAARDVNHWATDI